MRQEDYNEMMRHPWEQYPRTNLPALPVCPECGERYMGDGAVLCAECEHIAASQRQERGE